MNEFGIVLFHSTSSALRTEKLAKQNDLSIKLVPVPRELSSDCGVCIRFYIVDKEKIEQIIRDYQIEYLDIVVLDSH